MTAYVMGDCEHDTGCPA